jgi:hypothetical protein
LAANGLRRVSHHLLGRHVIGRSHDEPAPRQLRRRDARHAEVQDLQLAFSGDEQVGRLHVAMHDAPRVREGQPLADARHDLHLPLNRHRLGIREHLVQAVARQEFHHDIRPAAFLAEIVNRDDVAVHELAGRPRLAEEPLARLFRDVDVRHQHLDGHLPPDHRVLAAIDDAHPALADLVDELVSADALERRVVGAIGRRLSAWRQCGRGIVRLHTDACIW